MSDDAETEMVHEWTADPFARALDDLWNAALGSVAQDWVGEDGKVGKPDESTYIRYKTRKMRAARETILLTLDSPL
jgi:hypothetical protein